MPQAGHHDVAGKGIATVFMAFVILGLGLGPPLRADFFSDKNHGTRGPAALKRETGVRAVGLGGAFVGVADDASAVDWNPAGLQHLPQSEFLFMHEDAYADQFHEFAAFARPFWKAGKRRTWGGRFSYLSMDPIDTVVDGEDAGRTRPWESVLGLSYAETMGKVSAGISGKVVHQEVAGQSGQAYALDAGFLGKAMANRLTWGASLSNVGTQLKLGSETIGLPVLLRGGGSYTVFPSQKGALLLALEFDAPIDDKLQTKMGVEFARPVARDWRAALRGGYRTDRPTEGGARFVVGAGVDHGSFRFNYAFSPDPNLGSSNRFDLAIGFGGTPKEETRLRALLDETKADVNSGNWAHGLKNLEEIKKLSPRNAEARVLSDALQIRFAESLDPDTLFEQGEKAFTESQFEKSAEFFRKLIVLQPDRSDAAKGLARADAAITQIHLEKAKAEVARGRQREVMEQVLWAREDERQSRWERALARWQKALALDGNNAEAKEGVQRSRTMLYEMAEKAETAGDLEKARALFNASQDGLESYRNSARRLSTLDRHLKERGAAKGREKYDEGSRAFGMGDWERAKTLFEEALILLPDDQTIRRAWERVNEELARQQRKN